MISVLKICFFMLSNFGYWEFFRRKCKIDCYFLPVYTIAVQFMILFFAGLLNVLVGAAVGIFAGGLLLAGYVLYRDKERAVRPYLTVGYSLFALSFLLIAVAVKGKLFEGYDNFSHWALVVKHLLNTDQFPNFSSELIEFQSYPLGSAAYIYYFCRMTSSSESFQMLAQAFMTLSCMLPWFVFIRKNKLISTGLMAVMINFLLCYNVTVYNLLVDTLLPLSGTAALLFVYHQYRPECKNLCRENIPDVLSVIPLLCWTAQIKNSGIFFSIIAGILLMTTYSTGRKEFLKKLGTALSPAAVYFLWIRHCDYVFMEASTSKHSMRAENLISAFEDKDLSYVGAIFGKVAEFAVTRLDVLFLLLWLAILGVITFLLSRDHIKSYRNLLVFSVGLYIVYMICLAGMYAFSMPEAEAETLSCANRYTRTIDIMIYALLLCYSISLLSSLEKKRLCVLVGVCLIILQFGIGIVRRGEVTTVFHQYRSTLRSPFEDAVLSFGIPKGKSYLVCVPDSDTGYYRHLCKYVMDSKDCISLAVSEQEQLDQHRDDYKYMIILDWGNQEIDTWVQENYPEQAGCSVVVLN